MEKKKIIKIPSKLKSFTIELPPKNQKASISCNVALILAKVNNTSPISLAEILKKHLLSNFDEFKSIEIAGPGFINIYFHISFWEKYLSKIIKLNYKYGSNKSFKKKYNIEFVSANPTGPLHVGHCRGAVLGDVISNLLIFNGNKVTKEYYVNDYGGQIKNFVTSVYYRILEITEDKPFPKDKNLGFEPLMGWRKSDNTYKQIQLKFDSLEQALLYVEKNKLDYILIKEKEKKFKIKSYSDNFKYNRLK